MILRKAAISQCQTRQWQALPKVLLHEHLDGGLRPQTLLELCQARALTVPAGDAAGLAAWCRRMPTRAAWSATSHASG